MPKKLKLEKIESIEDSTIKDIFSLLCENAETEQTTKLGKPKKNKDGTPKPKILSTELKENIIQNTKLYFFEKYDDDSLSCTEFDINDEIAKEILKKYKNNFERTIIPHKYQIINFDIEAKLGDGKDQIMKLESSKVNNLTNIQNLISNCNNSSSDVDFKKLDFYVIKTEENGKEIYFFEKYESSMRLDKTRLLKALISRRQKKFNKVSGEEHFYLNYNMSCFLFGDFLYILRKPTFERIFDYEKVYHEICTKEENIKFVEDLQIFDSIDNFKENLDTDSLNILRKFSHLMNYQKEIKLLVSDISKVKQLLKDWKVKGVKIENDKISIAQSKFQSILKFLGRGQREHPITKEKFDEDINVKDKK